jgi:hypothetical protein
MSETKAMPENGFAFHDAMQLSPTVAGKLAAVRRVQAQQAATAADYQAWQLTGYDPENPDTVRDLVAMWERERDVMLSVFGAAFDLHDACIAYAKSLIADDTTPA